MKRLRLKNKITKKVYDISHNGEDVYLDGVPAIIGESVTSSFVLLELKQKRIMLDPDRFDLFFMYDVSDDVLNVKLKDLLLMDRSELIHWVRNNKSIKYININRAKFSIIRQLINLRNIAKVRNYIEVAK